MPVTKAITSILLVGIALFNTAYAAETATSWGQITSLTSDRNQGRLQITTTTDFYDVGCSNTKGNQYSTDPTAPNAKLLQNLISQAFFSANQVQLILDGCYKGVPRIVNVYIMSITVK